MSERESRTPFTSRGFIFGAIVFGVLVLAGILIAVTSFGGGGGGRRNTRRRARSRPRLPPNGPSPAQSLCRALRPLAPGS